MFLIANSCYMPGNCFMPRRNCCCTYPLFNNSIFNQMNLMMNVFTLGYATGNALQQLFRRGNNNIFAYQPPMYSPYQGQYCMPYEQPRYITPSYNVQSYSPYNYSTFGTVTSSYKPALNLNTEISAVKPAAKKTKKTKTKKTKVSTKNKLSELNKLGYSKEIGQKLAQNAAAKAKKNSTGYCARYVKQALEGCGLGNGESGDAYKWEDILRRNPNFKEVKISGKDFKKLPAGCIIVYPKGDAGYSSQYGHIEISLGNGKAVSDFVNNIKASDNATVFIPINA